MTINDSNQETCAKSQHQPGYMLALSFVRGDGTREDFYFAPSGQFVPPED